MTIAAFFTELRSLKSPCDGCPMRLRCGRLRMACKHFEWWVNCDVKDNVRFAAIAASRPENPEPNGRFYLRVFGEK